MTTKPPIPRPPFWYRLSIVAGNDLQLAGLVIGGLFLYLAAHSVHSAVIQVVLMLVAWIAIYLCCHALGHWVIGRLVGIRFTGYGIRGTDHPESYPIGMRQIMSIFPFFTVMTDKSSMARASATSKALMFAAGETSTSVFEIAAGWYAWHANLPGGGILFIVSIVWALAATVATAAAPKGDYAKAIKALRGSKFGLTG